MQEIINKYRGRASVGTELVQRIVNWKIDDICPAGLSLITERSKRSELAAEIAWLEEFLDYNTLNRGTVQDFTRQGEFEGQVLARLIWNSDTLYPELSYIPWYETGYEVHAARRPSGEDDYTRAGSVTYTDAETGRKIALTSDFVFVAFNCPLNSFEGSPTLQGCLMDIEDLSRALRLWNRLNRLFSTITPYFETQTDGAADKIFEQITNSKWRLGNAFAGNAKLSLIGPTISAAQMIKWQMDKLVTTISGHTGCPPHYLGSVELMSNRSTAEMMEEPGEKSGRTTAGRWLGFWEQVFDLAISMRNRNLNRQLRVGFIAPSLGRSSRHDYTDAKDLWLPAWEKSAISTLTLHEHLPDIDPEEEARRMQEDERLKKKAQSGLENSPPVLIDESGNRVTEPPGDGGND